MNIAALVDGLLPVVLWLLGSQNSTEVQQVIDGLRTLIRARAEDLASFIRHDVLLFARDLLKPLTVALVVVPIIGIAVVLFAEGACSTVNVPRVVPCLLLVLAIVAQVPSIRRILADAGIRPSRFDLNRGRVGREAAFDDYTLAERQREAALLGFVLRDDADTNADRNLTPERRATEIRVRNEHLARLRARRPVPPLMDVQALVRAFDAIGAAEATQTSVTRYSQLALFGAFSEYALTLLAVHALGTHSSATAGIAPIYVDVLGLVHVASFYLAVAAFALAVLLPVAIVGTVLSGLEQPAGGLYELIIRVLPGVDETNVRALFGRLNASFFFRAADFVNRHWNRVQAGMGVLTAITLVKSGWLTLILALTGSFIASAMYKNQEAEGVDTTGTRRARALRLETWVMVGFALKAAIMLTTYFAPTWTAEFAHGAATFINGLTHLAYRVKPEAAVVDWDTFSSSASWWVITIVKLVVILVALVMVYSAFFSKNATVWGKRVGIAAVAALVFILIGMTGAIPNADAARWRNAASLACPGTLPPLAPEPVETTPLPPPVTSLSSDVTPSVAAPPARPRHSGHRRHANRGATTVIYANVNDSCTPSPDARPCSDIRDPARRANVRSFCGCR